MEVVEYAIECSDFVLEVLHLFLGIFNILDVMVELAKDRVA